MALAQQNADLRTACVAAMAILDRAYGKVGEIAQGGSAAQALANVTIVLRPFGGEIRADVPGPEPGEPAGPLVDVTPPR